MQRDKAELAYHMFQRTLFYRHWRQSTGTRTHSIFNSCKPNRFALHALPSLPLLLLAQFITKQGGFHSGQRQQEALKEFSQAEQSTSGLAFRILGQKQEQLGLVPYNATNGTGFLNICGWFKAIMRWLMRLFGTDLDEICSATRSCSSWNLMKSFRVPSTQLSGFEHLSPTDLKVCFLMLLCYILWPLLPQWYNFPPLL